MRNAPQLICFLALNHVMNSLTKFAVLGIMTALPMK